ncbi:MAG: hypothetical protein HXY21_03895 [Parvularculaceae bacterium]|nr:hypothetical protein [Parvularculaceae bacterium]
MTGKTFLGLTLGLTLGAISLAACTTAGKPDLVVSRMAVTPSSAPAGSDLEIASGVRNDGNAPAPADLDIGLYESAASPTPLAPLRAWALPESEPLAPGETVGDQGRVRAPAPLSPGGYFICGEADAGDRVKESDEDNNRLCASFTVVPGKPASADLVIDKVIPGEFAEASRIVTVRIRNAGTAPAKGPFRVMAFKRAPRQPLLLIECALTEGQLAAGSPSSCDDLAFDGVLAPGVARDLTGYFAHVVSNGAGFVRQPVKPGQPLQLVSRTIDFMVDGCFPPADGSPVECRVNEIDEINNFKELTFKSR